MMNRVAMLLIRCYVVPMVVLLQLPFSAAASPWCPTKSEARDKYPDAHLYWHSDLKCWDNRHRNSRDWPHRREEATGKRLGNGKVRPGALGNTLLSPFPGVPGGFPGGATERGFPGFPGAFPATFPVLPGGFPGKADPGALAARNVALGPPLLWADRWPADLNSLGKRKVKKARLEGERTLMVVILSMALALALIEVCFGDWIWRYVKTKMKRET